jgi:Tfp pilus assembly protein PilF/4-amino-4-deoxy-L-arabinose transferase-like glycosyltransferase
MSRMLTVPMRHVKPKGTRPMSVAVGFFLAVVFAAKLLVVWQLRDHPLLHPDAGLDTTAYANLARQVVAGDLMLGPGLYFVSPLYIYFLAAGLAAFESFTAVRMLQAALGTIAVACVFFTARAWFGPRAAWCAAGLAAATGIFTFYETVIIQSSIDAVLAAGALAMLTAGLRGTAARWSASAFVLAGTLFGFGILNRPNMFFGVLAVVLAATAMRRWRAAALVVAGVGLGIAPVMVRNASVTGEWALASSHGGLNLYIGNHAGATGFYREVPGIRPLIEGQREDMRRIASTALGRAATDAEASSYLAGLATTWIREHPGTAAGLFARKLFYTFHAQHVALPHSYPFYAYDTPSLLRFFVVGPWLLIPLGLAGLFLVTRERDLLIWAAFIPGYAVGVAVFFVAERYRLSLLVALTIPAGALLDRAWRALTPARDFRWFFRSGLLVLPIAVAVNWPLRFLDDGRWNEGLRLAQRLVITGDYPGADAWVERLERGAPQPGRAHHDLAMQLVVQGQTDRAVPHLRKSLERGFVAPMDDVEVWLSAARSVTRTEGPAAAEPLFRHAATLAPDRAAAHQQYGLNLLLQERFADAARELDEAVRLEATNADSLAHLAYAEIKLNRLDAGRQHVAAALKVDPAQGLARQLAAALRAK